MSKKPVKSATHRACQLLLEAHLQGRFDLVLVKSGEKDRSWRLSQRFEVPALSLKGPLDGPSSRRSQSIIYDMLGDTKLVVMNGCVLATLQTRDEHYLHRSLSIDPVHRIRLCPNQPSGLPARSLTIITDATFGLESRP